MAKITPLIPAFLMCTAYANAYAACNETIAGDGVIYVGTEFYEVQPEVGTIQQAVDIARECEFQLTKFEIGETLTASVTQGYHRVSNPYYQTHSWIAGNDPIKAGDLVRFGGQGKWYEIASATARFLSLTRPVDLPSGAYSYEIVRQPIIRVMAERYVTPPVDLDGIHYLTIEGLYDLPIISSDAWAGSGNAVFHSDSSPDYGHITFRGLFISDRFGSSISLVSSTTLNDLSLSIVNCSLIGVESGDALGGNPQGDIYIKRTRVQSSNDLAFLPSTDTALAARSVIIEDSSFVSTPELHVSTPSGARKPLLIRGRGGLNAVTNQGMYKVDNTYVSVGGSSGNAGIIFMGSDGASVFITDVTVSCAGCLGGINTGWLPAGITVSGQDTQAHISGSSIGLAGTNNCGIGAIDGATVNVSSTSIPYSSTGSPMTCTQSGGAILIQ